MMVVVVVKGRVYRAEGRGGVVERDHVKAIFGATVRSASNLALLAA